MKITYKPLPENGERIVKYGVAFERDQTVPIDDEVLAKRLLTNPYFVESVEAHVMQDGIFLEMHDDVVKELIGRKRRTKAEMEALRNGENQSTSSTPSPSDDAGG